MKPLRLGLIGAGPWGRNYIRTIVGLGGLQLTRVASRNPGTASFVPPGCRVLADWRELVRDDDVDALIVAAPPAAHAEIALAAIDARRPVLIEKPLALDVPSAERVLSAAAERGVPVMVDHTHLFHPDYEVLKRAALERGPVRAVRTAAGGLGPYRADVGTLWDWGPHDVAMCLDLLGADPAAIEAELLESHPANGGRAERLRLSLLFAAGVRAEIELDTLRAKHRSFNVQLDSGTLTYDGTPPPRAEDWPLARAVRAFAGSAAGGAGSLRSVELGVAVVRVLSRCEQRLSGNSPAAGRRA